MKRFFFWVCFSFSVMTLRAATYCAEKIISTNGKHTAKITCSSLGGNQYQFVFVSTDAFTDYNATGSNFYMNVNGVGGYQVSAHLTQTGNTLTATIESNPVPNIYVGDFFVNYSDGQAWFKIPTDADFSQTCAAAESQVPVMGTAVVEEVTSSSARIQVNAENAQAYEMVITHGSDVTTQENVTATDGYIELTGLTELTEYTLQIYATNGSNKSENSVTVSFTTLGEEVALYLAGSMNNWDAANTNYRFSKTAVSGVYALTTHLNAGAWVYKLTKGNFESGNCTADDHHLVLSEPTDVTFYARSVSNFASSADSIFLLGTAFFSGTPIGDQGWRVPDHAQYCAWSGTQAIWSGEVNIAGEYKIIKIAYLTGSTPYPYVYWDDLWEANQSLSGITTTQAIFTFDLPTLTWSWREINDGQCDFMGNSDDGQTGNGSQKFTTGYNLSLWLNATKDAVVLTAEFLDTDKTATIAYMQNYPQRDETIEINEIQLDRVGDTQIFTKEIPFTSFTNKADGVIRFGVKFAFDGGLRVTTPEFFYLDGSGCAKRIFTIYHHDDMPADPEDGAVTQYAGGRILQPICYKRMLRPDTWETLCLPFEVDSITVYDPDDRQNYKLYAQYRIGETVYSGEFWLREFTDSPVTQAEFQSNWQDIEADSREKALPKKGVPYIIRVPGGGYYDDKYIVFHGAGYQTIGTTYSAPTLPAEGLFSYSGNNTMRAWNLHTAYVLDAKGEYFWADQTVTLQPFECAVNATQNTINRMPRLQMAPRQIATDHSLPSTADEQGRIYTLMGTLVGQYSSVDAKDAALQRLPEGLYILQTDRETSKIYIAK